MIDGIQQFRNLRTGHHDGNVSASVPTHGVEFAEFDLQDVAVQKEDGRECLILCTGGNATLDRQMGQECFDFRGGHVLRMPPPGGCAVEADELFDPGQVGLLGSETEVLDADYTACIFEERHGRILPEVSRTKGTDSLSRDRITRA